MATERQPSHAERLGALIARAWRAYLGGENAVLHYLRSRGSIEQRPALGVWLLRVVLAVFLIVALATASGE